MIYVVLCFVSDPPHQRSITHQLSEVSQLVPHAFP